MESIKHKKIEQATNNSFDNVRENFRSPTFIYATSPGYNYSWGQVPLQGM